MFCMKSTKCYTKYAQNKNKKYFYYIFQAEYEDIIHSEALSTMFGDILSETLLCLIY